VPAPAKRSRWSKPSRFGEASLVLGAYRRRLVARREAGGRVSTNRGDFELLAARVSLKLVVID